MHFPQNLIARKRSALATNVGNHTEGAAVVASVLDFEIRAGPLLTVSSGGCAVEDWRTQQFGVRKNIGDKYLGSAAFSRLWAQCRERDKAPGCSFPTRIIIVFQPFTLLKPREQSQIGEPMLMRVADHCGHTPQRGNLLWSTLGVASGDDDLGFGVLPLNAADGSPSILIGRVRDRTSVQDDQIGVRRWRVIESPLFELALERRAVGLGGATPEIFHVIGRHLAMLSHAGWRIGPDERLATRQPARAVSAMSFALHS